MSLIFKQYIRNRLGNYPCLLKFSKLYPIQTLANHHEKPDRSFSHHQLFAISNDACGRLFCVNFLFQWISKLFRINKFYDAFYGNWN